MSFVQFVSLKDAAKMVRAINEAKTEREHLYAQIRCEGYEKRCDEMGEKWPCCELDTLFTEVDPTTGEERPTCCGEYLDWRAKLDV